MLIKYNFKKIIFNKKILKYTFFLFIIVIADAISVLGINYLINEAEISYISFIACLIIILSAFSHTLQPIIIFSISKIIRKELLSFAYDLNDSNYQSLEGAIQKDEMIFLNLIVSDISISVKLLSIVSIIAALLLTAENSLLPLLALIPLTIIAYRKFSKSRQNNISKNISSNFHDITEIRKSGGVLSKSIFFNKSYEFISHINNLYDSYYRDLAKQSSLSNGYRTAIEISAYISIVAMGYFNSEINILKSLIVIGYSAVKVLPIIQQLNFYISVRKNGNDQLDLVKSSNKDFRPLNYIERALLYSDDQKLLWVKGKSGSGKTTLIDGFANDLRLNSISFGYYVQNQYPLRVKVEGSQNIDWVPKIDSIKPLLGGKYSIGEIQRLALFDIFSNHNHNYILLDEPFSSQSDNFVKSISIFINRLIKDGTKVIIISHMDISLLFESYQEVWCNYDRNNTGPH
ncbi:ABC transporter ATP-binding protein [Polynucleobacter sp. 80A-SIGWE]|uniref:ATP-binding cassette domain-containing protein n=1 Tax=Polynucleobacter sp. 80A-SIGWE TaxID=2689100 RepID=UPI001C0D0544|nr:ABC transporter ATP-binding protein [Polynucleobacter sp. 80A-SIGWE]MBU3589070.1 hypothetical protein [Polynucleobacter sp. 80A-SIGWE]